LGSHMVPTSAIPSVSQVVAPHRSYEARRQGVSPRASTGIAGPHAHPIPGTPQGADPRLLGGGSPRDGDHTRMQRLETSPCPGLGNISLHLTLPLRMLFARSILPCLQRQLFPPKQLLWPGRSWFRHGGASLAPVLQPELEDWTQAGELEGTWPWARRRPVSQPHFSTSS